MKIGLPKRKLIFQPSIFRCYVSFGEGIPPEKSTAIATPMNVLVYHGPENSLPPNVGVAIAIHLLSPQEVINKARQLLLVSAGRKGITINDFHSATVQVSA